MRRRLGRCRPRVRSRPLDGSIRHRRWASTLPLEHPRPLHLPLRNSRPLASPRLVQEIVIPKIDEVKICIVFVGIFC